MTARILLSLVLLLTSLTSLPASAQVDRYVAGTHYTVLQQPVRTSNADKIEVVGVFWYGCPHCFSFEPLLNDWAENCADDIAFVRFPAIFNSLMKTHAQIFYAAENLHILDRAHDTIFDTLVMQRKQLQTEDQVVTLFAEYGVDADTAAKAFNSFSVKTKVNQAQKLTNEYKPRGTPSMVVNGKYLVSLGGQVDSQQEMLRVVDFLTEKERS